MVEGEYVDAWYSSWIFDLSVLINCGCGVGQESVEFGEVKGIEVVREPI